MRLTPNLGRGRAAALAPLLVLAPSCDHELLPGPQGAVQANLAVMAAVTSAVLLLLLAVVSIARRRRGPLPLARLLLAGSLRDMQEDRPRRHRIE